MDKPLDDETKTTDDETKTTETAEQAVTREEFDALLQSLDALKGQVTEATAKVQTLETENAELQTTVEQSKESEKKRLEKALESLDEKQKSVVLAVGDDVAAQLTMYDTLKSSGMLDAPKPSGPSMPGSRLASKENTPPPPPKTWTEAAGQFIEGAQALASKQNPS